MCIRDSPNTVPATQDTYLSIKNGHNLHLKGYGGLGGPGPLLSWFIRVRPGHPGHACWAQNTMPATQDTYLSIQILYLPHRYTYLTIWLRPKTPGRRTWRRISIHTLFLLPMRRDMRQCYAPSLYLFLCEKKIGHRYGGRVPKSVSCFLCWYPC